MNNKNSVLKLMILQILLVGSFIPLSKYVYNKGIDPLNFTYQFMIVASLVIIIYTSIKDRRLFIIKGSHLLYLLIIAIIGGGFAHAFLATGLKLSSAINCTFIMQISVFFIPVLSYFILKEHLKPFKIFMIVFLLIGVYMVTTGGDLIIPESGDFLIIGSSLSFSIGIVLSKIALKEIPVITFALYRSILGSLSIFIFLLISGMVNLNISWEWVIIAGMLGSISILTMSKVLESSSASYLSMMSMSIPVVTAIIAHTFLDEKMTILQIVGGVIVVLSGIFVHRSNV
ncbi:MAG: DMT family transporter [Spirochaetota bacterium]|nr:DMT family transporter [Spirochaetota bacterium]